MSLAEFKRLFSVCAAKKEFVVLPDMQGQDEAALEMFTYLGLTKHDIDLLFRAFWDIDADGSGAIRPLELFAYFEMEDTPFENSIFTIFDDDKSGYINFMEFVCSLWNLLTLPEPSMGSIAFHIKDATGLAALKYSQVKSILEIMHKKKVDSDPALLTIFNQFKRDYKGIVSKHEFCEWTRKNPSVTYPLVMLQLHLRLQIIGEAFWVRMANNRMMNPEQGALDFVNNLMASVIEKNNAYKKRIIDADLKRKADIRRGRGIDGDCRDNVARKESILLKFFDLKKLPFQRKEETRKEVLYHEGAKSADEINEAAASEAAATAASLSAGGRGESPVPEGGGGNHSHSNKKSDKQHHHNHHHGHHGTSGKSAGGGHVHMHDGRGAHNEAHRHGYETDAYQHINGESHKDGVGASHKSSTESHKHHHHQGHVNKEYFHPHSIKTIERDEKDPFRIAEEEALAEMERERHRHHHSANQPADDSSDEEVVVVQSNVNKAPPRKRRSIHSTKPNLLRKELADKSAKNQHKNGSHKSGKGSSKKVSPSPPPASGVTELSDLAKGRRHGVGDRVMT